MRTYAVLSSEKESERIKKRKEMFRHTHSSIEQRSGWFFGVLDCNPWQRVEEDAQGAIRRIKTERNERNQEEKCIKNEEKKRKEKEKKEGK